MIDETVCFVPNLLTVEDYQSFCTFKLYLNDAGITDEQIINHASSNQFPLKYDDLPLSFWENSLLEPRKYYYHHHLQNRSGAPVFDRKTFTFRSPEPYVEMKIAFTIEQLYAYYCNALGLPLTNSAKDIGGIRYVLNTIAPLSIGTITLSKIDFILYVIDYASTYPQNPLASFLDIYQLYSSKAYTLLLNELIQKQNKIILRTGEIITCGI